MTSVRSRTLALAACALLAVSGCRSSQPSTHLHEIALEVEAPPRASLAAAPMALDESIDTTFDYLVSRYDRDGDGAISSAEYTRKAGQFETWDRDGDGQISIEDFARPSQPDMSAMMARRMVARYFQADDDAAITTLSEARDALENVYDGSAGDPKDGQLVEAEFRCAMEARHMEVPGDGQQSVQDAMGDLDPWSTIAGVLDGDEDGAITADELGAFYALLGTQEIDYRGWDRPRGQRGGAARRADAEPDGAPENEPAPDFTLSSPDGETTVTLSDFAGVKPVALIFGSYT